MVKVINNTQNREPNNGSTNINIINLLNTTTTVNTNNKIPPNEANNILRQLKHAATNAKLKLNNASYHGHGINGHLVKAILFKHTATNNSAKLNNSGNGDNDNVDGGNSGNSDNSDNSDNSSNSDNSDNSDSGNLDGGIPVICKCHPGRLDRAQLTQFRRELNLINKLQKYPPASNYVNPCMDVIISPEITVSIFPAINGISLRDATDIIMAPDFLPKYRYELVTFICRELLDAIQRMHDAGICHLQLEPESILIDLNKQYTDPKTNTKTTTNINDNIVDKIGNTFSSAVQNMVNIATGQESIYYLDRAPQVGIRLTNFGIGCAGRDIGCSIKMAALNDTRFPRQLLACVESGAPDSKKCNVLKLGQQYDIGCCGQLLLDLLEHPSINSGSRSKHTVAHTLHSNSNANDNDKSNNDNINNISNISDSNVKKQLNMYVKAIKKYMLIPEYNKRSNCGFVREKIMLDVKHGGGNSTEYSKSSSKSSSKSTKKYIPPALRRNLPVTQHAQSPKPIWPSKSAYAAKSVSALTNGKNISQTVKRRSKYNFGARARARASFDDSVSAAAKLYKGNDSILMRAAFIAILKKDKKTGKLLIFCVKNIDGEYGLPGGKLNPEDTTLDIHSVKINDKFMSNIAKYGTGEHKINTKQAIILFKAALREFAEETGKYPTGATTKYEIYTHPRGSEYIVQTKQLSDRFLFEAENMPYNLFSANFPRDKNLSSYLNVFYYVATGDEVDHLINGPTPLEEQKGHYDTIKRKQYMGEQYTEWVAIDDIQTDTNLSKARILSSKHIDFKVWQLAFIRKIKKYYSHTT